MKKLLTILCLLILVSCSEEPPPEPKVLEGPFLVRDGITYDQKTNKPITGNTEIFHENGKLKQKGNYKNGKEISKTRFTYYENGKLNGRQNYKNDNLHGLRKEYDKKGTLIRNEEWKDGVLQE